MLIPGPFTLSLFYFLLRGPHISIESLRETKLGTSNVGFIWTEVLYFTCTFYTCNGFWNEIILGTVTVQPEPVLNEDKDDFKGPEFRSRCKMKPENLQKRRGKYKWKWKHEFKLLFMTILENLMYLLKIPPLFCPLFIKSIT